MTAKEQALKQIRDYYAIPELKFGMNVLVNGQRGVVSGIGNTGLKAKLIGVKQTIHFHPTWETCYCDENWNAIRDFRKPN